MQHVAADDDGCCYPFGVVLFVHCLHNDKNEKKHTISRNCRRGTRSDNFDTLSVLKLVSYKNGHSQPTITTWPSWMIKVRSENGRARQWLRGVASAHTLEVRVWTNIGARTLR